MNGSKKMVVAGWILSALIALFLAGASAMGKFTEWEGKSAMFSNLGWDERLMLKIGILEVAVTVLFVIPRTSFIGAILVTAYLGGATATHVRVGEPFYFPIIIGVLMWVALGLRRPEVFQIALGKPRQTAANESV